MSRPTHLKQIREIIDAAKPGAVFIPLDFSHVAESVKINMCLNRLKDSGELTGLDRGVFMKPRYSKIVDKPVPPRADDIAMALARKHGWSVIPCGDTALNALGLSTQVPAVWAYVSSGPYKDYELGGVKFQFKHTDKYSELSGVSYETALVIQTLKAIGKGNASEKDIRKLAEKLSRKTKDKMLTEAQYATSWVYEYIKRICAEDTK